MRSTMFSNFLQIIADKIIKTVRVPSDFFTVVVWTEVVDAMVVVNIFNALQDNLNPLLSLLPSDWKYKYRCLPLDFTIAG